MMNPSLITKLAHPFYGDHVLYHAYDLRPGTEKPSRAWAFNGWRKESLSWRNGCYIHAGLSRGGPISIIVPEAKNYLQSILINSLEIFPVGSMKHGVMCTDDGLIAAHGIIECKSDDHFEKSFAGGPPGLESSMPKCRSTLRSSGLTIICSRSQDQRHCRSSRKATGESLRDVKFLRFRNTSINGIRTEVLAYWYDRRPGI